jgi:hypothetical protein
MPSLSRILIEMYRRSGCIVIDPSPSRFCTKIGNVRLGGDRTARRKRLAIGITFVMTSHSPQHGFEEVFTVTDYYDGPRQGIADYLGLPHFYDCIFSDERQNFTSVYHLTPVSDQIFQLALEDWAIWKRWEHAFKSGKTVMDTHPALPEDAVRHSEIEALLADGLKTDPTKSIVRAARFLALRQAEVGSGILAELLVKWSEPSGTLNDQIWADPFDVSG